MDFLKTCLKDMCLVDHERSVSPTISPRPWQTDSCIGGWHYRNGQKYKSSKNVIDLLVDIVSKNGNLLLNFPLPASDELDADEMVVLRGIEEWMAVNGEGIFDNRPWKIYGEGPAVPAKVEKGPIADIVVVDHNQKKDVELTYQDFRFTTKGSTLYAFAQGWPSGEAVIRALAPTARGTPPKPARS